MWMTFAEKTQTKEEPVYNNENQTEQAYRVVKTSESVTAVDMNAKIQSNPGLRNTDDAKKINEYVKDGKYSKANLVAYNNPKMRPIFEKTFRENAEFALREKFGDEVAQKLIDSGALEKYFQQYVNEISKQQQINKRATEEFAAQQLKLGFMRMENEKNTVDETKRT